MSTKYPVWASRGRGGKRRHRSQFYQTLKLGPVTAAAEGGTSQGVAAVWTGLLADIPTGWNLCDGGGGRPDLRGLFVRGSAAGVNPGGTGGSDTHSHTEPGTAAAHNHTGTSGSAGAHQHTTPTSTGDHTHGVVWLPSTGTTWTRILDTSTGSHNHTWPSEGAHTHTIDSQGAHAHTPTSTDDGRPAYYEVAFIMSDGSGQLSAGVIVLWSGLLANIPANFTLCDGGDTRPNLIARFLRGAPAATDPGTTGGADSHTHATIPAGGIHTHTLAATSDHTHTSVSAGSHNHGTGVNIAYTASASNVSPGSDGGGHTHTCGSGGAHSHTTTGGEGSHTHVMDTSDGRPPYLELAPIIASVGATLTTGLIGIWTGLLANIPTGWTLCDGGGGRPDMRGNFHRGVNTAATNPGTTGGAATHTHTVQAGGGHTHTHDSQGGHTHAAVSGSWSHSHGSLARSGTATNSNQADTSAGASHGHGDLSSTGAHSDHSVTAQAAHTDHTYDATSSLPSYYDVAFIYKD